MLTGTPPGFSLLGFDRAWCGPRARPAFRGRCTLFLGAHSELAAARQADRRLRERQPRTTRSIATSMGLPEAAAQPQPCLVGEVAVVEDEPGTQTALKSVAASQLCPAPGHGFDAF